MLKSQFIMGIMLLFVSPLLFAQENDLIQIKERMAIEFAEGHGYMTKTRTLNVEDAMYTMNEDRSVRYTLTKKGTLFSIYRKDDKGKWGLFTSYVVAQSFIDVVQNAIRYNFLTSDGSLISYLPKTEEGKLAILDLSTEDVVYFVYD